MRDSLEQVEISADLLDYIVAIVRATRNDPQIQVGASPRGGLALVQLARGQALLNQRDYVVPDDIKQVAVPALAHRVTLRPELWVRQVSADEVVAKLLAAVPTPKTDPTPGPRRPAAATRRRPRADVVSHPERPAATSPASRGQHRAQPAVAVRPGTPAGCSRWPWPRCSSRRWPGGPSSRAWPRPRCCCSPPGGASGGRRGSASGSGRAPGGPSRASWWPSTWRRRDRAACGVRWTLHPGREIEPGRRRRPPTGRRPASSSPRERWGRRQIGTVDVVLRDRWRLAEGHADRDPAHAGLLPGPGPAADPGGAQPAAEPARRASGPDVRRGHRVRRRARVRPGRPAAQHQLAGQHPARAAAGEHVRRRALAGRGAAGRRHLGRRRARVIRARPRAARRGGGGPRVPGRQGPGGRDHLPVGRGRLAGPGLGRRQVYRIIDSMLASERGPAARTAAAVGRPRDLRRLPRAALPPGALVVVFSPLLDQRFVETLRDMRERGFTMLVVDVLNADPPARPRQRRPDGPADLADGAGGDQVLAARARRPGGALGRGRVPGPAAGRPTPAAPGSAETRGPGAADDRAAMAARARRAPAAAAVLLGAGCVVWAAVPLVHQGLATLALVLAICGVAGGRAAAGPGRGPGARGLLPAARADAGLALVPRDAPPGALGGGRGARPRLAGGAALLPAVAHRGPRRRARRLPARHAPGRVRRVPGRCCGRRCGCWPSGRPCSPSARASGCCPRPGPGAGSALLRLVAAGALIAAAALVLPYVARSG